MESVHIRPLRGLPEAMAAWCYAGQVEAGRLWSDCVALHVARRKAAGPWPDQAEMHAYTKGRYALHNQTVQQVAYQFLANVAATTSRRQSDPASREWLRYPYKAKRFYPLCWPAQAASYDAIAQRLILPMGRGRPSLLFPLDLDFTPGAVKLVWNDGYELHIVRTDVATAAAPPGDQQVGDI